MASWRERATLRATEFVAEITLSCTFWQGIPRFHEDLLDSACAAARVLFALFAAVAAATPVHAARVGVLSNKYATETAADFNTQHSGACVHGDRHVACAADVAVADQRLRRRAGVRGFDLRQCHGGRQRRSPRSPTPAAPWSSARSTTRTAPTVPPSTRQHGWGALEQIDPNTTDGTGDRPYAPRTLDTASLMLQHRADRRASPRCHAAPSSPAATRPRPGTTVVAYWTEPNARGQPDPAIAFRITGAACVIQIGHRAGLSRSASAPAPTSAATSTVAWKNAFDFGANRCVDRRHYRSATIPTLSTVGPRADRRCWSARALSSSAAVARSR